MQGYVREHSNTALRDWCTHIEKCICGQGVTEPPMARRPRSPSCCVNQKTEPSAGGELLRFGIDAEKRRWGRAQGAADSGYHGSVGSRHPWCGISSLRAQTQCRAEKTGACANPWLQFGRRSRAEGQRGTAVEDTGKRMAASMSCVVRRSGDGEPGVLVHVGKSGDWRSG